MLKGAGFSMQEIQNMTMAQLNLYCKEVCKKDHRDFKSMVLANLYGSRGDEDAIKQVID